MTVERKKRKERREKKEEKMSMIIVVPSCLKDADGARTRSDQFQECLIKKQKLFVKMWRTLSAPSCRICSVEMSPRHGRRVRCEGCVTFVIAGLRRNGGLLRSA